MERLDKFVATGKTKVKIAVVIGSSLSKMAKERVTKIGKGISGYWNDHEAEIRQARD